MNTFSKKLPNASEENIEHASKWCDFRKAGNNKSNCLFQNSAKIYSPIEVKTKGAVALRYFPSKRHRNDHWTWYKWFCLNWPFLREECCWWRTWWNHWFFKKIRVWRSARNRMNRTLPQFRPHKIPIWRTKSELVQSNSGLKVTHLQFRPWYKYSRLKFSRRLGWKIEIYLY